MGHFWALWVWPASDQLSTLPGWQEGEALEQLTPAWSIRGGAALAAHTAVQAINERVTALA